MLDEALLLRRLYLPDLTEYKPGTAFSGVIGRTVDQSEPAWPEPLRAKEGAPNVLFFILDDTGFGQLGCYGSPINTPNLDALAANGLVYNNMHTTALCSPTRTCVLTGRNHHSNGMAAITEASTGFPGYNANVPFENGFLSEILRQHGYSTYAVGKWHLTPADQISAAGPYERASRDDNCAFSSHLSRLQLDSAWPVRGHPKSAYSEVIVSSTRPPARRMRIHRRE